MTFVPGSDGSADRHVTFVCSCSDMASNVDSIADRHTARMTYSGIVIWDLWMQLAFCSSIDKPDNHINADFHAHTKPCWHASAANDLS